jgi:hypothetical protein
LCARGSTALRPRSFWPPVFLAYVPEDAGFRGTAPVQKPIAYAGAALLNAKSRCGGIPGAFTGTVAVRLMLVGLASTPSTSVVRVV